ncbi:hypothetical protein BIS09_12680 [Halomonas sp. R1t8]|uniref:hypothetical protein n=1 Tax=Halomonadaceae TaxID=28256 RepID=UPI0014771D53|nr:MULTISPECIES: hypothetical protein [Halomonas]MCP1304690.1 hypothetical protein [Halomonas sp. R1t8]
MSCTGRWATTSRPPYAPWTAEDLAWLAGADDASGCYPDRATPAPAPTTPAPTDQLALF